eukprot:scaffold21210_cov78-Skeletonema_dohrnii-CCMP3373.AAC.1
MDGGDFDCPCYNGFVTSNGGAGGGVVGRWGESGGASYSAAVSNPRWSATASAIAMEAVPRAPMQQYQQYHQHNTFINSNYTQQTQGSSVGWTHGRATSVPYSSYFPLSSAGGGPGSLPQSHHSNSSYSNDARGQFVASAGTPANHQQIAHQYFHNPRTAVAVYPVQPILPHSNHNNVPTNVPHPSFATQHKSTTTHPIFPTGCTSEVPATHPATKQPTVLTSPLVNNATTKFYPKDILKEFFAEGQHKSLTMVCPSDAARKSLSRIISGIPTLHQIWKRQDKNTGFCKGDSIAALSIIVTLDLPSRKSVTVTPPPNPAQQIAAVVTSLENSVKDLYSQHISYDEDGRMVGKDELLKDPSFTGAMRMLKAKDIKQVSCDECYTAMSCQSPSCDRIMVVRSRKDNQLCCPICAKRTRNAATSAVRNEKNRDKRVAPGSKTPLENLSPEERKQRLQNERDEKKRNKKGLARLKEKFAREADDPMNVLRPGEDETDGKAQKFISGVKELFDGLLKETNRSQTKENLRQVLTGFMSSVVEHDKSAKSPVEVDMEEVEEAVDFVVQNMMNTSLALNGKSKQCKFSPLTVHIANLAHNTSPAAFREMKANCPLHMFPSERQMQRNKKVNKVTSGQTSKPYEIKRAEMNARNIDELEGYLECDEMKLKDGVVWNTKTNQPVGLADDMLDLDSLLRRVLSEDGHTVEAAKYVNQWQFVAITDGGVEHILLEHFFNDGSLTAKTLNKQLRHVLLLCESIGLRVSGLCFDAGGNNSKLLSDLHGGKRIGQSAWLRDEECYIEHPHYPTRRIYIWFCSTHVLKAMRNQFLSSRQKGPKEFVDKYGNKLGWAFLETLYEKNQDLEKSSKGMVTTGVRLTERVINPNKSDKMNVRLAKIPFECKTLAFAITYVSEKLGVTADQIKEKTAEARSKYINMRSESSEESFSDLKHGHFVVIADYLMEVHRSKTSQSNDTVAVLDDCSNEDECFHVGEEEEDDDEYGEFDELDRELELFISQSDSPSASTEVEEEDGSDSLGSEIASLQYMTRVSALFHDFIMCKNEKISAQNVDLVESLVKDLLSYFDDWKAAQMKKKSAKVDGWERMFLAPQTWKNLRHSLCGFVHFSRYMTGSRKVEYVPALVSNQSSMELVFSRQRRTNHDSATTYSSGISSMSMKSSIAHNTGRSYDADDCVREKRKLLNTTQLAKQVNSAADEAEAKLLSTRKEAAKINLATESTWWMFDDEEPVTNRNEFKGLARKLNHELDSSAIDIIMGTKCFHFFVRLNYDNRNNTMRWLEKFVSSNDVFVNSLFTTIMKSLLVFFEESLFNPSSNFEMAVLNFIATESFHTIYAEDHLQR